MSFSLSPSQINEIIVREQSASDAPMILRVKKPDFLGDSMWEFQFAGRSIPAKMADLDWLKRFREGQPLDVPVKQLISEGRR